MAPDMLIKFLFYSILFYESENEIGCLVTHIERVLYIPRASSLLKDVRAHNVPTYGFFLNLAKQKGDDLLLPQIGKIKLRVTDLVLERICPEEHPKSEKSGLL